MKTESKKNPRSRSKINHWFDFKEIFFWRSYIWFFLKNKKNTIRADLIYKTCNKKKDETYDFQKFKATTSFGREIDNDNLSLDDALEQSTKQKKLSRKKKKYTLLKTQLYFLKEGKKFLMLNILKSRYFQKDNIHKKRLSSVSLRS